MRKLALTALGAIAVLGFAAPAMAHENDWNSRHDWQHDRIEQRHDNVHDRLDDEHYEAHDYRLSGRDHRALHRDLRYEHERADYRISQEHRREHRLHDWRPRSYLYGY